MEKINKQLKQYIEENILPQYDLNNIGGHGIDHIKTVMIYVVYYMSSNII